MYSSGLIVQPQRMQKAGQIFFTGGREAAKAGLGATPYCRIGVFNPSFPYDVSHLRGENQG